MPIERQRRKPVADTPAQPATAPAEERANALFQWGLWYELFELSRTGLAADTQSALQVYHGLEADLRGDAAAARVDYEAVLAQRPTHALALARLGRLPQ